MSEPKCEDCGATQLNLNEVPRAAGVVSAATAMGYVIIVPIDGAHEPMAQCIYEPEQADELVRNIQAKIAEAREARKRL